MEWELCSEDHTRLGREGTLLRRREKVWFSEEPGKSYKQRCLEYGLGLNEA